jgi:hypothetical protein
VVTGVELDWLGAEDEDGVGELTGAGAKVGAGDGLEELELLLLLGAAFGADFCLTAAGAGSGFGGPAGSGLCAAAVPAPPSRASVARKASAILRCDGNWNQSRPRADA